MIENGTLIVGIGRNLPLGGELPPDDWQRYAREVFATVATYANGTIYFDGFGMGFDASDSDRDREDSYTVISAGIPWNKRQRLIKVLRRLADEYGQESIAVTSGDTQFVYANQ